MAKGVKQPKPKPVLNFGIEEVRTIEEAKRFLDKYGIDITDLSDEEVIEKIQKIGKAKQVAVQVLSRGRVLDGLDRLLERVPKGFRGEFKRESDIDIKRAMALGWRPLIDDEAKKDTPTGKADGLIRFGDQILMIMPEEEYVAMRIAREERIKHRREARKPIRQKDSPEAQDLPTPIIEL